MVHALRHAMTAQSMFAWTHSLHAARPRERVIAVPRAAKPMESETRAP